MRRARHNAELVVSFVQVASDAAAVAAAFFLSYWLRFHSPLTDLVPVTRGFPGFHAYALSALFVFLVWVFVFGALGMYGSNRNVRLADELLLVVKGASLGMLIVTAAAFFYRGFSYSRIVFVLIWASAVIFLFLERAILIKAEARLYSRGRHQLKGLIAGSGSWSGILLDHVRRHPGFGVDIVGCAGPNDLPRERIARLGDLGDIRSLVVSHGIDAVFLAPSENESTLLEDCLQACAGLNIAFYLIPHSLELMSSRMRIHDMAGVPVLVIKEAAITGWNVVFKRAFDLAFSVPAVILLAPVLLLIAALVKLGGAGTVLYRQRRVGLDGREFDCLKFRTMRMDAEAQTGPVWTSENDPRVTPVGRFLRRFSLDELPQLLNVIRGEMSLVGPRPERPHFVEQFKDRIPKYLERHRVRSGMTGWAQVNGLRGNVPIDERTKYDVYYVENWSLLFDIKIILITIWSVIRGENSY